MDTNQKLILANQLILFRDIDHDGIYLAISKGKTLENIRGEYKSSLSFKPETINIRRNALNETNKNRK